MVRICNFEITGRKLKSMPLYCFYFRGRNLFGVNSEEMGYKLPEQIFLNFLPLYSTLNRKS